MKIQRYKQLTENDREKIYKLLKEGFSQRGIAQLMKRNVSTISRELNRNSHQLLQQYLPDTATRKHEKRKQNGRKKRYLDKDKELQKYVISRLKLGWTPDLISGRMETELGISVSHETIYQFIYSKEGRKANLRQYLPRAHRIRRKKKGRKHQKGKIPDRIDISNRPMKIEERTTFGHWEGDSVLYRGTKQVLATQVERKSRFLVIGKPKDRTSGERVRVIKKTFRRLPNKARRTITFDNGLEFAQHTKLQKSLHIKTYFAKPYASWQRGTNEWVNGILRRYLPRGCSVNHMRSKTLKAIQNAINSRPMKCLGYQTPKEVFTKELNKLSLHMNRHKRNRRSVALAN